MREIPVSTHSRSQLLDITAQIQRVVSESGIKEGICHIYVPHTTAGLTINEGADPSVRKDILMELDRNIPWDGDYHHLEGNAAAHIKASLVGSSKTVFIEGGRLILGTWQAIFFCEFDGPRRRRVLVKITGG
ncbi:MAG TPA: YjbQ family protein [Candidatus Latescibacteria bacterium]|nr:YjbQ family protein [Candidatus Latescibacterota bacterium]